MGRPCGREPCILVLAHVQCKVNVEIFCLVNEDLSMSIEWEFIDVSSSVNFHENSEYLKVEFWEQVSFVGK